MSEIELLEAQLRTYQCLWMSLDSKYYYKRAKETQYKLEKLRRKINEVNNFLFETGE